MRLLALLVLMSGCGLPLQTTVAESLTVTGSRVPCAAGPLRALTDAGDEALCLMPKPSCDPALDVVLEGQCHYPPSPSPASACCDPRPAGCAPSDCDCLLRTGPWIDSSLAEDAGTSFAEYDGPRLKCSYRLSCTPGGDGGTPVIRCTPA